MKSANVGRPPRTDDPRRTLELAANALRDARRVLVLMQGHPDGDACGSSLGLALALEEMGKSVTMHCPTPVPDYLRFLAGLDRLVPSLDENARWDATVVCDVGHSSRIGMPLPERTRLGAVVNIDHHLTSDDFGDVNFVDAGAAAVGVMIHRLLGELGHRLSRDVATALYVSVLTDTGSFRYSSTDPEALRTAAALVEAGADPWDVSSNVYEQQPVERLRLLREVLGTLDLSANGRFSSIVITQKMLQLAGADRSISDGFVNFVRGLRGVEVAAQFSEQEGGHGQAWSVSLRSRGRVNVAAVAERFGGGGHHNAAGLRISGAVDEARAAVAAEVLRQLDGA